MWKRNLACKKDRELWLDITKCICIVLVVLNHIYDKIPLVTFFGGMMHMPTFFVAAGYTYRNKGEKFLDFVKGKAKRLLIPYFVCNVILVGYFTVMGGLSKTALLGIF